MRSLLLLATVGTLGWLVGCGGGTPVGITTITVSLTPSTAQTIKAGGTVGIVASTDDPNGAGVSWSFKGVGQLTNETTSSVSYVAPMSVTSNQIVTVTAASISSPASTASLQITVEPDTSVSVSLSPAAPQSLNEAQTVNVKATVRNSTDQSVTWTLSPSSGAGTLTPSATANPVTYNAPSSVTSTFTATLTATAAAGSKPTASLQITVYAPGQQNTAAITVDGGLESETGFIYEDAAFATVTVCIPGTSVCDTIDHVLVDTGSYGLRLLTSAAGGELSTSLPPEKSNGNPLNNCVAFVDGSYLWGSVATADVQVGGEIASSTPIQVIQDPTTFSIPDSCTSNGTGTDEDSLTGLGANGILGIGPEPNDCTLAGVNYCTNSAPPEPVYYSCSASGCDPVNVPVAQQVTNPIVLFPTDNNGVILTLPSLLTGQQLSADGSLVFGIGTETNNTVGAATVYTMNTDDNITTSFSGQNLAGSFIDSGSNGLFFPSSIAVCGDFTDFYCPASTENLSAINTGANNSQGTVNFSIANADTIFANDGGSDAAYSELGGPNGTYPCNGSGCSFDWGLAFFFGRSVFTSIDGQTVSGQPATPWWAY